MLMAAGSPGAGDDNAGLDLTVEQPRIYVQYRSCLQELLRWCTQCPFAACMARGSAAVNVRWVLRQDAQAQHSGTLRCFEIASKPCLCHEEMNLAEPQEIQNLRLKQPQRGQRRRKRIGTPAGLLFGWHGATCGEKCYDGPWDCAALRNGLP